MNTGTQAVLMDDGRLFQALVDCVRDRAVFAVDENGIVLSWNQGAEALTGYSPDEMLGTALFAKVNVVGMAFAQLAAKARSGTEQTDVDLSLTHRDGRQLRVVLTIRPIELGAGRPGFAVTFIDHGKRRQSAASGPGNESHFRLMMDNSPVGLALVSLEGRWLEVNRAITELLGYTAAELSGQTFQELTHQDDLEADLHLLNELLLGQRETYQMEKRYLHKNGSLVWGLLSVSLMRDANGEPAYFISQIQDITDVREIRRELEHNALHDPLTGLGNRRKFQSSLADALEQTRRAGSEHCLCFLDLDGFKAVNDSAGHEEGDKLLVAISRELEKSVRGGDLVARLGGDEFGLILYNCPISVGQTILKRLCDNIASLEFASEDKVYSVTASIGLAPLTPETNSSSDALRRADLACYEAKRSGRNAVRVHGAVPVQPRIVTLVN